MFCQKCGTQNAENAAFCKNCGASMMAQQNQQSSEPNYQNTQQTNQQNFQQTYQQNNQGYQQNYQQNYQNYQQNYQQAYRKMEKIYSSNPAINAVKKIAASPIFLTGVILYSVYALFQLISTFSGNAIINMIETALKFSGAYGSSEIYAIEQMLEGMRAGAIIGGLLGMIPTLLVVLALWLIFTAGRNIKEQGMKTAGLTIIKVLSIISLVTFCVTMGLSIIAIILLIVFAASLPELAGGAIFDMSYYGGDYGYGYGYEDQMKDILNMGTGLIVGLLVVVALIIAASFVINLLFYIKTIKTLNSIKNTVDSGRFTGKISMYLIVMLFITASANVLTFSLAGLSSGVAIILFAVALIKLRGEFKKNEELEQVQQNYGYNPDMNYQAQQIPNNNF